MHSFWKNAGIMAFAEIFLKLKAFIMMPFITKYLGTLNYGIWSQVMVTAALLSPLVFFGTDTALAKFLPGQSQENQRRDFSGWFLFGLLSSLLIFSLVWLYCDYLAFAIFGSHETYSSFVILAGLNIVVTALSAGVRNWFRIQSNAKALVFFTISQNITQMFILIWILSTKQGIYELILLSVVFDLIFVLFYIAYFFYMRIFVWPSINHLWNYLKFGIVLLPGAYAIWGTNSLDRVFMAHYNSLVDIGIYSIAFTFGYTLIQTIVTPIWSLFFTKGSELYNHSKLEELNTLLNQSIKLILWLMIPSIFGLILIGDNLLRLLTTEEFSKGYMVIPLILAAYLFLMISSYFESILTLRNKPYFTTYFLIISFFINLILNIFLIPKYSYIGAALATMLAFGVQNALSYFYFKKEKILTLNTVCIRNIFCASIAMFIIMLGLKMLFCEFSNLLIILLVTILGGVLYLSITFLCGIYQPKYLMFFFKKESNCE